MSIPTRERRDYIPYFKERDAIVREDLKAVGFVFLLVIVATVIGFGVGIVPLPTHAEAKTPKKDYPLTNRGSCERLHEEGMAVEGASMREIISLCAKEGVSL